MIWLLRFNGELVLTLQDERERYQPRWWLRCGSKEVERSGGLGFIALGCRQESKGRDSKPI
jgi:hypothetical protein